MAIDPEALYIQLGRLLEAMPELTVQPPYSTSTHQWLGRVEALIDASGDKADLLEFQAATSQLKDMVKQWWAAQDVTRIIHRALAKAELKAPAAIQGSFIPAGNSFDAMAAIGKVLNQANQEVLIIDPYLDGKVLTDFAACSSTLRPAACIRI
jgi:hypothetical protein